MNDELLGQLARDLKRDEGLRLKPYKDTVGKLTIGIGRNLDDVGVSEQEAFIMLANDIKVAEESIKSTPALAFYVLLNDARKRALLNMVFNMGMPRFLGFRHMIGALRQQAWDRAGDEALDSKWAKQVGVRANRIAFIFRHGKDCP